MPTNPTIKFNESTFQVKNLAAFRDKPEVDFAHRLKTKDHLAYLEAEKLFDVTDPRWAKATINGEVHYAHEYDGCVFEVRLQTANAQLTLSHNHDGALDRHLMDNPGEHIVYSITSKNNGLESTQTFSAQAAGMASAPILAACIGCTIALANGLIAMEAESYVAAVLSFCGLEVTVNSIAVPVVGLVLAVLAFIGVWIAYAIGREIMLNLIYENRSNQTIKLVDHYVYNIGDNGSPFPATLKPLQSAPPFDIYDDVVVCIDNYSKFKGIGVSMIFQKQDQSRLAICIRQDIYKNPAYQMFPTTGTALEVYANCGDGPLITTDWWWGKDLYIKNCMNPEEFMNYNFSGIISFHSP